MLAIPIPDPVGDVIQTRPLCLGTQRVRYLSHPLRIAKEQAKRDEQLNKNQIPPRLIPTQELASYFESRGITYMAVDPIQLGFGHGKKTYEFYSRPGPADDETMGVFCEWHTGDYFEVDSGPHMAIGMRGPVIEDPHRGRGLAIGILASHINNPEDPDKPTPLFVGCPDPPGGPSFFIEDFTVCDGKTPIIDWQLSEGRLLPQLSGDGIYRIDVHVSRDNVWVAVWQVIIDQCSDGQLSRTYRFLDQVSSPDPGFSDKIIGMGCEDKLDKGIGNVFMGTGFSDPETNSHIENIYIAHWKNPD